MSSEIKPTGPKACYCVKCRTFLPVAYFESTEVVVAEGGAICDRHEPEKKGLRYCKGCDDFVALDLFPRKFRPGYACRKHLTAFGGVRECRKKRMRDPDTKRRAWQWKMCYNDARMFMNSRVAICEKDVDIEITKVDQTKSSKFALMPLDIGKIISVQNSVVVTLEQRKILKKLAHKKKIDEYTTLTTELRSFYP